MVGLSTAASGNSGFILVAAVGLGFTQGFEAFLYVFGFFIGEYIFWTYYAGKITARTDQYESNSVSELLSQRKGATYSRSLRSFCSLLTVVFIGVYLVAQLLAAAKILNALFGLAIPLGATLTIVLILAYCTTGGLRASIWTDIVQACLVALLTIGVSVFAFYEAGGPALAYQRIAHAFPELLSFTVEGHWVRTVLYLIGCVFLGFGFSLSMPHLSIRLMAGRNQQEVRKARWIYLSFLYSTWGAMTFFGILCRILLPDINDPEQSLPHYIRQTFSPAVVGVLLAGMFSTIASTADSQLLACSSALARDLFPKYGVKMQLKLGIYWHYLVTLSVGILALILALFEPDSVFNLVLIASAALTATLGLAMFIRTSQISYEPSELLIAMVVGLVCAVWWQFSWLNDFIYSAGPGFCLGLLVYTVLLQLRIRHHKSS